MRRRGALMLMLAAARAWRPVVRHSSRLRPLSARPSAVGVALELRTLKDNADVVKEHVRARGGSDDAVKSVDAIVELNTKRAALQKDRDAALATRKKLSGTIGKAIKNGEDVDALKAEVAEAGATADAASEKMDAIEQEALTLLEALPNVLADVTPEGRDETDNVVLREWGTEKRKVGEDYKWHDDLAAGLSGYDPEAASRVAGARFAVLKGGVARLERALANFFLDSHLSNGYEEVSSPLLVSRSALRGTGQLPKFEDDLFRVANHGVRGEDAFLIPTSEVPLTNFWRGETLQEKDLPIRMVAHTPCFRAEAGSYGRDTRGLIRQHQFGKVELVKIVAPEDADEEADSLLNDAEKLLQALELPYRAVQLCAGDVGFSAQRCVDLEVWLPGQQEYREVSSCSLMGDFQARRMNLRYKPAPSPEDKKPRPRFPCTMNGSGLAVGRALVAVLENHQNDDGSVNVPEVLRPYLRGAEVLAK